MSIDQVLWECFRHFVHFDEANAAMHCALVRYSPITFRCAEALDQLIRPTGDRDLAPVNLDLLNEVLRHRGQYAEDPGR